MSQDLEAGAPGIGEKFFPVSESAELHEEQPKSALAVLVGARNASDAWRKWSLVGMLGNMLVGMIIFVSSIANYVKAGVLNSDYYAPGPDIWAGLCVVWLTLECFLWWRFFEHKDSKIPHYLWVGSGGIMAVNGFISLISYATMKGFGSTAPLFLFWITTGACVAPVSFLRLREATASGEKKQSVGMWKACCQCCCSCSSWILGFGVMCWAFGMVFIFGVMIGAAGSASDMNRFPPIGKIYKLEMGGDKIEMHLYCQGQQVEGKPTIIFEHGGGSNSLSLKAIADDITAKYGRRTCIYDRMGYGWTPSYYTSKDDKKEITNTGMVLKHLLHAASEQGPFICVGHSAGAQACMSFVMAQGSEQVEGIAMLDGYPEIIRAGSFRPGPYSGPGISIDSVGTMAVLAGPTGLTRGLVGATNSYFEPKDSAAANTALYGQPRFWFSQYWDMVRDDALGQEGYIFPSLGGEMDDRGVITYGMPWNATKVVHMPASMTVETICRADYEFNDYCCGGGNTSSICKNRFYDSQIFLEQADKYVSTLSAIPGNVIVTPRGADHAFPYDSRYIPWTVSQLVAEFPSISQ